MSLIQQLLGRMPMSSERAVFLFGVIGGVALTSGQFLFAKLVEGRDKIMIQDMMISVGAILVASVVAPTLLR